MNLTVLEGMPDGLLTLEATELHSRLSGPTLIHLDGQEAAPLFVSVLQHGNETSGWDAMRAYLAGLGGKPLPRRLMLFIANPAASQHRLRSLPDQPDMNRCWPGHDDTETGPVHQILREVTDRASALAPFASIDIHNNSGRNPHYAASTRLNPRWLHLASLFDRRMVWFRQPLGVQCDAFSVFCPAVTVECGLAGVTEGVPHCVDYIERVMQLDAIADQYPNDLELYHTIARVKVPDGLEFVFGRGHDDALHFRIDLDALNFLNLPAGTPFAEGRTGPVGDLLQVIDEFGQDVTGEYFEVSDGALRTRVEFTPSMLSRRVEIVKQDCLCYVMKRMTAPGPGHNAVIDPSAHPGHDDRIRLGLERPSSRPS